ncbi:glycosyltransferase family 39 protein [bacterium]|nr:glycosyltransferase family 39 protein [bacterium]
MQNKKTTYWLLLAVVIAAAFLLRAYNIENIPAGIYPDEAVNGTDALLANETGNYRWFYTNNFGREGLFINLIAGAFKIFGVSIFALKFWPIIFGTLTVLGVFLLSFELFRGWPAFAKAAAGKRAALIAAYLTAFSFWAINFSRIAFRAVMMLPVLVFSFYFIFRGLRTEKYRDFILAGLIFGLGFHTYIAFRIAPLILIILLLAILISQRNVFRRFWKKIIVFAICVFISASPLLFDFYQHPEYLQSRTGAISVFSPEVNQGHLIKTLSQSVGLSLVKFNFWGDQNWRHNYPPYPVLNPVVGILFLIGLIYLIAEFFHLLFLRFKKKTRDRKFIIYSFLLSWFFALLIPEFLTAEGLPHCLRSIGTLPVVYIISAIPFAWILGKFTNLQPTTHNLQPIKIALLIIFAAVFAFVGIFNTAKYFVFWAEKPQQHGTFSENFKNIALYLNSLPDEVNKYVAANGGGRIMEDGLPVSAQPVKLLTYQKTENLKFLQQGQDCPLETPMVIILMNYDQYIIDRVKLFYPQAQVEKIDLNPGYGSDFVSIVVE